MKPSKAEPLSGAAALLFLQQHLAEVNDDVVPEGFLTVQQWSREFKKSRRHTAELLTRSVAAGLAVQQTFVVKQRTLVHYKLSSGAR